MGRGKVVAELEADGAEFRDRRRSDVSGRRSGQCQGRQNTPACGVCQGVCSLALRVLLALRDLRTCGLADLRRDRLRNVPFSCSMLPMRAGCVL